MYKIVIKLKNLSTYPYRIVELTFDVKNNLIDSKLSNNYISKLDKKE